MQLGGREGERERERKEKEREKEREREGECDATGERSSRFLFKNILLILIENSGQNTELKC